MGFWCHPAHIYRWHREEGECFRQKASFQKLSWKRLELNRHKCNRLLSKKSVAQVHAAGGLVFTGAGVWGVRCESPGSSAASVTPQFVGIHSQNSHSLECTHRSSGFRKFEGGSWWEPASVLPSQSAHTRKDESGAHCMRGGYKEVGDPGPVMSNRRRWGVAWSRGDAGRGVCVKCHPSGEELDLFSVVPGAELVGRSSS